MSIIGWIILGGLAGWIASKIHGNDESQGILGNIVVGILGGFLGGWLLGVFGGTGITGFNIYSFLVALGGAVLLLWIFSLFRGKAKS